MRPRRSTWVASITSMPAPELASMPRWVMCQSLPTPSSALYWHIGDTTMRFGTSRPASRIGENRALVMTGDFWLHWGEESGTPHGAELWITTSCAAQTARPAAMPYHGGVSQGGGKATAMQLQAGAATGATP